MPGRLRSFLRNLFCRDAAEQALDAELQSSIDILFEEKMKEGFSPEEARRRAHIELGGIDRVKEEVRSIWIGRWFKDICSDLRFGLRLLLRKPGFTVVAVATLALGIGANTAVISVVNAVILRPLSYANSNRLIAIHSTFQDNKRGFTSAPGVFLDWRDRSRSFEMMSGAYPTEMIWRATGQPRILRVGRSSSDFFPLLGVWPERGRWFRKDDDQCCKAAAAMLGGEFWKHELGGDETVLGKQINLDGASYEIIGILPSGFSFADFGKMDVWLPLSANRNARTGGRVMVVGRLRMGATLQSAQAEMDAVMDGIRRERREDRKTFVLVKPLHDWIIGDIRPIFLTVLGTVAFLLLICCANISNLLLMQSTARQREMAVRASLGAGRLRLVRQTLAESVLLSFFGGVFGLGLAALLIRAVPSIQAFQIPRIDEIALDHTVLIIAAALTLATGMLFGLAPAIQVKRSALIGVLRTTGQSQPGARKMQNALVAVQFALALMLLAGAGLMCNSLLRLLHIDLGFEPSNVTTISVPFDGRYDRNRSMAFLRRIASQARQIPGVEAATVSNYPPLMPVLFPIELSVAGASEKRAFPAQLRLVDPEYLNVMRMPLLKGRALTFMDEALKPAPVIVSKKTAAALFGARDPIGRILSSNYGDLKTLEVIGVTGDAHQIGLTEEPGLQLYIPLPNLGWAQYVLMRTAPDASNVSQAIQSIVRAMDPELPPAEISTLDDRYYGQMAKPRFYLLLMGSFAAMGMILAALGIYGVIAYGIALRTQEFGIRIALGAERRRILQMVLRSGLGLIYTGAILGSAGSLALTRLLASMLYQVHPNDPLTFGCVLAFLVGIGLLASLIAARRAVSIDPNIALRCE